MAHTGNRQLTDNTAGMLNIQDACVVLVKTEWNHLIVDELEKGCVSILEEYGVSRIRVLTVPGAVEIPFAIRAYWENCAPGEKPEAFIALGCVIKGDTPHFDYVCRSVTDGITQLNLKLPAPVVFGVLTVNDEQQATDRIGGPQGHKGKEAGITAMKMLALKRSLS